MQIKQIISELENIAPLETQEEWDNSGWQILPENESKNIEKIFLCLSLTKENILQAKENHCELIISHHPFLFPHAVMTTFLPFSIFSRFNSSTVLSKIFSILHNLPFPLYPQAKKPCSGSKIS